VVAVIAPKPSRFSRSGQSGAVTTSTPSPVWPPSVRRQSPLQRRHRSSAASCRAHPPPQRSRGHGTTINQAHSASTRPLVSCRRLSGAATTPTRSSVRHRRRLFGLRLRGHCCAARGISWIQVRSKMSSSAS
jgi:hypothetical protein